jgi:quercetin dioxygenase-like cupin family protein
LSVVPDAVELLNLTDPTSVRTFPLGRFELFRIGGLEIGRAVYEPGWRWTEHVRPTADTELCEVEHVGLVLAGRAAVRMRDSTELTLTPGDFFSIPPGHDSWVVGDEEYVSLHFLGADRYARGRGR